MNSDKNPKKSSKESSRISIDSNSTPPPNFQLPPEYWWNPPIPKNNLREILDQANLKPPRKPIPDDGTFSPIPPDFRYTAKFPSHYPPSTLDWGEPSFDVDCSDDADYSEGSIPQKIPMKNKNVPAQNAPAQNNTPAQDDGFQYLDIDMWNNDEIINQLHLSNSLFNDEESNQDEIDIPQEAVPNQIPAPVPAQSPVRVPAPIPTPAPAPATKNNGRQYIYKSLEKALDHWVSGLKISPDSKPVYKSNIIKFVRLLDTYGVFNPSQNLINNYCDQYFSKGKPSSKRYFRIIAGEFFSWVSEKHIYNKINPHKEADNSAKVKRRTTNNKKSEPRTDLAAQVLSERLSDLYNDWLKTLKGNYDTNTIYQMHVLDFMMFLIKINKLSPTLNDIKTYFNNNLKTKDPNCKDAIKRFLQFMEHMEIPQDHEIYKFLDSNDPI